MHWVFQINRSAGKKAQGVCRLLNDKILEIGLTAKILTAGGETYFVVSASDERLRSEASRLARLETESAFFFSQTEYGVESSRDNLGVSLPTREKEQLLRSVLATVKITRDDLDALRWVGLDSKDFPIGNSLIASLFIHTELLSDSFPLHEDSEVPSLCPEIFRWAPPSPSAVRTCFGSKMALYFAFLRMLNLWLIALAVAAVVAEATIYRYGISSKWAMLYGSGVSIWSALFLKYWARQDASLIFDWDFGKLKSDAHALRWQLRGQKRMLQATGHTAVFHLSQTVRRHLAVTVPVVIALLLPSTVITLIGLNLESKLNPGCPWYWPAVVDFGRNHLPIDTPLRYILLAGAQAALRYFVNRVYSKYCVVMSRWEAWQTEDEFIASVCLKRLPFDLLTFFLAPVLRAVWGPSPTVLRHELFGLVVADFALRLFVEVLWPRLQTGHRQWPLLFWHAGAAHSKPTLAEQVQIEAELPTIEVFDGYCLYVRHFLTITWFASVFPMGAVLCLVMMWLESKASLYCLLRFRQRPGAMRATNIGIWFNVLKFVSASAIPFNCFLQAHTTGQIVAAFANSAVLHSLGPYAIAFAIEQILRLSARLIHAVVPDVPPRIRESYTTEKRAMAARRWAEIYQHNEKAESGKDGSNYEKKELGKRAEAQLSGMSKHLPSLSTVG